MINKALIKKGQLAIFLKLPYPIQLQLAKTYCNYKRSQIKKTETPKTLIFFITSRCNLRCGHCFYWKELNAKKNELKLAEIERIASSLKTSVSLSLTGGEPFIRREVKEICEIFHKGCGTRSMGIATNGTFTERIIKDTKAILDKNFLTDFSIQVSLDGLEETHDEIRCVLGSFKKAISTLEELSDLRKYYPSFSLHVALAIQKRNLEQLEDFVEYLLPMRIPIRFNIVRGGSLGVFKLPMKASSGFDPKEDLSAFLTIDEIKSAYRLLKDLNQKSECSFWSQRQHRIWELSIEMLEKEQCEIPCYAQSMEAVLYSDGDVAFCELSKPFANIREFRYDFSRLWKSDEANGMRRLISRCFCIHGCNLTTGLTFEPETVMSVLKQRGL